MSDILYFPSPANRRVDPRTQHASDYVHRMESLAHSARAYMPTPAHADQLDAITTAIIALSVALGGEPPKGAA